MFEEQLDYAMARNRDMLQEAERRRTGVYEREYLFNVWEAVRQAAKRLWQSYNRRDELCLELQPACEMRFG
jgi:predicted solute-binding protein